MFLLDIERKMEGVYEKRKIFNVLLLLTTMVLGACGGKKDSSSSTGSSGDSSSSTDSSTSSGSTGTSSGSSTSTGDGPVVNVADYVFLDMGDAYAVHAYTGDDTSISIPANHNGRPVKYISQWAFSNNGDLVSVVLPESITKLSEDAFWGCTALDN